MKLSSYIFAIIISVTLFAGCKKDSTTTTLSDSDVVTPEMNLALFSASRSDSSEWSDGDSVGVAIYSEGSVVGVQNCCYSAVGSGSRVDFNASTPLYYPESGEGNVFAYYPYNEDLLSMEIVDIDVNYLLNNLLVAAQPSSKYSESLTLEFEPILSLIEFNLSAASTLDYSALNNVSISIEGLFTTANYDVVNGALELNTIEPLRLNNSSEVTKAISSSDSYSAYVIPQSIDDVATVTFSFNDGAMLFSTDLDISSIEAGSVYTYSAEVSTSGVDITSLSISKWNDGGSQSGVASIVPIGYTAIYDVESLKEFLSVADGYSMDDNYILMDNIDLGSDWSGPVSYSAAGDTYSFRGIFDGNGKSITIDISDNDITDCAALFYSNMGTIKNLNVMGRITTSKGGEYGGIAVSAGDGVIRNCSSSVDITCSSSSTTTVGGIVGSLYDGAKIYNCYYTGDISATEGGSDVGGIVGYMRPSATKTLMNVYSSGSIEGEECVGDIIGELDLDSDHLTSNYPIFNYLFAEDNDIDNEIIGYVESHNSVSYDFSSCAHLHLSETIMRSSVFVQILNNEAYSIMADNSTITDLARWERGSSYPILDIYESPLYEEFEGLGTKEYPYIINSESDLNTLSSDVAGGDDKSGIYFAIMQNIILSSDSWTPIGTEDYPFQGHIGAYSISSDIEDSPGILLNINSYNRQLNGLFGVVGESATIENITVSGTIAGNYYCAGIAAKNYGTISNCTNNSLVSTSGAYSCIAGIVAMNMSSGTVDNCLNDGVVYENGSYVTIGGVVGSNYAASSSISNSTSTSDSVQIYGYSTIYNSANNYAIGKQN